VDYPSEKTLPMAKAFSDGFCGALPDRLEEFKERTMIILNQLGEGDGSNVAMTTNRLEWIENTFRSFLVVDI
jgi:hypothetical protein